MAEVTFESVRKVFPGDVVAVDDFNLEIQDREFLILVGPSGCGKSTSLRMVAGLEEITGGQIKIGGKVVNDVPPKDRDIAMVFQNYALYPHMTVYKNMAFGLKLRKYPKDEIDKRVKAGSEPTSASAPAAAVDDDSEEEDEEADELEAVGAGAGKGKRKRRRGSRSKKS